MKVKDLPNQNAALDCIKVVIPATIPDRELNLIGLNTRAVYVTSGWFNGTWVKKEPGHDGRVFPLTGVHPSEVLEWEVVDETTSIPDVDPYDLMRCENAESNAGKRLLDAVGGEACG